MDSKLPQDLKQALEALKTLRVFFESFINKPRTYFQAGQLTIPVSISDNAVPAEDEIMPVYDESLWPVCSECHQLVGMQAGRWVHCYNNSVKCPDFGVQ